MPAFGTTISAYNKKPSTTLTSFAQRPIDPAALTKPIEQPKATLGVQPMSTDTKAATQPPTVDPTKSAVGGSGANFAASGLIGMIPGNTSQMYQTGLNSRQSGGGEFKILDALDQRTGILNDEVQQQVNSFNQRAGQKNAANSYGQAGDQYDITGDSGLDSEQMNNARQIASIGKARGLDDNAIKIAIMTALTESGLKNVAHGDRDSVGLFQQRTSQGWGTPQQILDPNYSANKFYDALGKVNYAGMSPWQAAQAVQKSFDPTGTNYQIKWDQAQKAFSALTPKQQAAVGGTNAASSFINQYNNKYLDYDGAYGAQCVDLYNFYATKFVGADPMMGRVGYAQDIFNNYDSRAFKRLGPGVGNMGDVAVFRAGGGTPSSHVAIVVGDNGDGTLRVLQSNATPQGSAGNSVISNISKATLMGYLRPNRLG